MKKIYPLQKINLVERPEWSAYDMAGELGERVFMSADDTISAIDQDSFEGMVDKIRSHGLKKVPWLQDGEAEALYKAWKDNDSRLEGLDTLVRDLISWSWEKAFMPTDGDIQDAILKAIDRILNSDEDWTSGYESISEVMDALGKIEEQFLPPMFTSYEVYLIHDPGFYDRFLEYDPADSVAVKKLFREPIAPEAKGVFDWMPALEVDKKHLASELAHLFGRLKEPIISKMFYMLERDRRDISAGDRFDTKETWNNILADKDRIKSVGKEIEAFRASVETPNG